MLSIHLASTLPGFMSWLVAHWPTAPHGCQWEYGHAAGHATRWVEICRALPKYRHWPVLVGIR